MTCAAIKSEHYLKSWNATISSLRFARFKGTTGSYFHLEVACRLKLCIELQQESETHVSIFSHANQEHRSTKLRNQFQTVN